MTRHFILLLAFIALLASVAAAQRPAGLRGGQNLMQLVRYEAVQKEINLSEEQSGKLRELLTSYQKDVAEIPRASREELQKLPAEERRKKQQEIREALGKVQQKYQKQLGELLERQQTERLSQIRLQMQGPTAIASADVAEKLGLSREERRNVQTALRELFQGARQGGGRPSAEQRANLREKLETKLKEILSEEQLAKFNELKGKPFDLSQLRGRPGRRRQNNDN